MNSRKPWHRTRGAAGLPDVWLHDLRHSFASVAVAGGLSLPVIGARLGHSQPAPRRATPNLAADPLRAAELIGARLDAAMTPPRPAHLDLSTVKPTPISTQR